MNIETVSDAIAEIAKLGVPLSKSKELEDILNQLYGVAYDSGYDDGESD